MKILITAILLVLLPTDDWIDKVKTRMDILGTEAELAKEKIVSDGDWTMKISKYNYKNERLILFEGYDSAGFPTSFKQKTYLKKNKICVNLIVKTVPMFYKGESEEGRPLAVIVEENSYFKNKEEGIEFYREIECFAGENTDSLQQELKKLEFEQKPLNTRDYKTFIMEQRKIMRLH